VLSSFLGKYRVLVAAIAAFFSLSVGVYTLNYLLLSQVGLDAARINAGGKLRGYSQQFAKAVLTLAQEFAAGDPMQTSRAQISEAQLAFDTSLSDIRAIERPDEEVARQLVATIDRQWQPLREAARALLRDTVTPADIDAAVTLVNTRNVRLLQLADDFTRHEERRAAERAQELRYIQFGAIALALLNFLFIVVHVARRLQRSEREAEQARRETGDILRTVREGLFLMTRDGTVGTQRSAHLDKVFPHPLQPGDNFLLTLGALVSEETVQAARQYVELLFNERVKPALLLELNPLQRVEVRRAGRDGPMYLNFSFHPVRSEGRPGVSALLVAAVDVSREVRLEQELAAAQSRAQREVSLLLGVLETDPSEVARFLVDARARITVLNDALRDVQPDAHAYQLLVTKVFRQIHAIKGEASALSLTTIADHAHGFEDELEALRKRRNLAGEDLIPVATAVARLMQEVAKVEAVVGRLADYAGRGAAPGEVATAKAAADEGGDHAVFDAVQRIQRLALGVASELGKKLRVETSVPHLPGLPAAVHKVLREGLPQLVRNAVVHGIEGAAERSRLGKKEEGRLRIELLRADDGGIELTISDDGRGIDVAGVRRRLEESGAREPSAVAAMSDREVVAALFEPGVSTAAEITRHAGRGVGLDVVGTLARETGARLKLASAPNAYTRFTLQWSPA
jgi:HPt (histidine-containing phosphotransfer) domain-containing protein/histone H3/H4